MTRCELLEQGGRAHFMTRRLDRVEGRRIHVQSYCALVHRSYNEAGLHRYEDLFQTALDLGPTAHPRHRQAAADRRSSGGRQLSGVDID